jgi:hypothetical protein
VTKAVTLGQPGGLEGLGQAHAEWSVVVQARRPVLLDTGREQVDEVEGRVLLGVEMLVEHRRLDEIPEEL